MDLFMRKWLGFLFATGSDADPGAVSLIPAPYFCGRFLYHEIFSIVILLPLIQEGLLSVTSESMCTEYWLTP